MMAQYYMTAVFASDDHDAMSAFVSKMDETAPMMRPTAPVWTSGLARADVMSVSDAIREVVNARCLDDSDKVRLIEELLAIDTWDACKAKFDEWDLVMDEQLFELVNKPA